MNKKHSLFSIIIIWILIISCNLPAAASASITETSTPTVISGAATADVSLTPLTFTSTATTTINATQTLIPTATACMPNVTAPTPVNVRSGPGTVYEIIGVLVEGGSATVAGKNYEGTWWYIDFPSGIGGHAWVGGSVVNASCIPATLAIIAAPPTPVPPTATSTPVVAAAFAVTSVNYVVSTWSDAGHTNCPRITANITVNSAGNVDYKWNRSDGSSGTGGTLVFAGAGTQSITADWALGSVWAPAPNEWMGIYIDNPNHQNFGHANMPACTAP